MSGQRKILLGVTGSVAAKLTPKLVAAFLKIGEVQVVATEPALYFWKRGYTGAKLWTEADEWPGKLYRKDQEVPHIALGDWASVLVIAPLTANTLTKLALGIADNLLTCVAYALPRHKPLVVASAMNTRMWESPLTQEHFSLLRRNYPAILVVPPVAKTLACGTVGMGAMADIQVIVEKVDRACRRGASI